MYVCRKLDKVKKRQRGEHERLRRELKLMKKYKEGL